MYTTRKVKDDRLSSQFISAKQQKKQQKEMYETEKSSEIQLIYEDH